MKAFSFPLQSLLVLRSQLTEQAFLVWAAAMQDLQQANMESQRIQAQLKSCQIAQRERQANFISAAELFRNHQSVHSFFQLWETQEKLRLQLEKRAVLAREKWREIRRKEEILERLKKRSWEKWQREQEQDEQKLNDERASLLSFRSRQRMHSNVESSANRSFFRP